MLAADVRYRAADDGSYLLPGRRTVKEEPPTAATNAWRTGAAVAGVEGLEPPTPGFGDRCSSH